MRKFDGQVLEGQFCKGQMWGWAKKVLSMHPFPSFPPCDPVIVVSLSDRLEILRRRQLRRLHAGQPAHALGGVCLEWRRWQLSRPVEGRGDTRRRGVRQLAQGTSALPTRHRAI